MNMKTKKTLILSSIVLIAGYFLLVFISNLKDHPIPFPASEEVLAMGFNPQKSLKFCVYQDKSKGRVLSTVIVKNNQEYLLPLASSYHSLFDTSITYFENSHALIKNIKEAKPLVRKLIKEASALGFPNATLQEKDVDLQPFMEIPTKLLHGTQSMDHYRNAKRAAVKRGLPNLGRFILIPYNFVTNDDFYSTSEEDQKFDFFHGNNTGLYTTGDTVPLQEGVKELDVEVELAVVISKPGRNIAKEEADEYIAGYLFFNDFTDREAQRKERSETYTGYQESKYISSLGAYFVTDIDPSKFAVRTLINGKEVASACNDEIIDFMPLDEQIVNYSKYFLASGQVIALGTMRDGSLFELDIPMLRKGDVVEFQANQGLGNTIHTIH